MTECFRRFISYNSYFVVYASSGGFDTALPTQPPRVAIMVVSTLHRFAASYFVASYFVASYFLLRCFILHSTTVIMSAPWSPGVLERKRKNAREQRAEGWNLFVMNSLQEEFCCLRKNQRAKNSYEYDFISSTSFSTLMPSLSRMSSASKSV